MSWIMIHLDNNFLYFSTKNSYWGQEKKEQILLVLHLIIRTYKDSFDTSKGVIAHFACVMFFDSAKEIKIRHPKNFVYKQIFGFFHQRARVRIPFWLLVISLLLVSE